VKSHAAADRLRRGVVQRGFRANGASGQCEIVNRRTLDGLGPVLAVNAP
jgi:hypothetical protein